MDSRISWIHFVIIAHSSLDVSRRPLDAMKLKYALQSKHIRTDNEVNEVSLRNTGLGKWFVSVIKPM